MKYFFWGTASVLVIIYSKLVKKDIEQEFRGFFRPLLLSLNEFVSTWILVHCKISENFGDIMAIIP